MLNYGIIGTSFITDNFIDAANKSGAYKLHSVYSRKLNTAREFGETYGADIHYFDNLDLFLQDDKLDVVYVASPNGVHFEQTKKALQCKKHVIVEKPAFSTPEEMQEIIEVARKNNVFFFEAIRNIHDKHFPLLKDALMDKEVWGASLKFAKYSSKMNAYLNDEEPNIFSLNFSGGALMDLGVYLIYPAVALFGVPQKVTYIPTLLKTGVDGYGVGVLDYGAFKVTFENGKFNDSYNQSEIYLADGTIVVQDISNLNKATYYKRGEEPQDLGIVGQVNNMVDEAACFARMIKDNNKQDFEKYAKLAQEVNQVMYDLRMDAGIIFKADGK
ncbi:MAG: Gfo/Idh/MocA family oxidoreductase [Streptococcaceae bacterium]|nr:Gfo/Idh/MocA family oxidoreductase [Streptococcaceae bacterium]